MQIRIFYEKSRENLKAAELCFANQLYNASINRCYFAMFQMAIAMLGKSGIHPKADRIGHDWVQAEFARNFIKRRKLFVSLRGHLIEIQKERDKADYKEYSFIQKKTKRILDKATTFIKTVEMEYLK